MINFVILHYQAIEETINCINTIIKKVSEKKRIVVVDNCSPNGSGQVLFERYKDMETVKVILVKENLGFAKGNNIGYYEAKRDDPDFIVVMNNDVFIQQDNFSDLVRKSYEVHHFAIMGPDIYSTRVNGHQNPQSYKNYNLTELKRIKKKLEFKNRNKWLLKIKYMFQPKLKKEDKLPEFKNKAIEDVVLHGACYILSKDFIKKHDNCFFSKTFMYFESYILNYLALKEGLKMVYDPSIVVLHHEDIATNQTYNSLYQKAVFVNKCQLDSCTEFIRLIEDRGIDI